MNLPRLVGFILVLVACLGLALCLQPTQESPAGCPTSCNCTRVRNGSFLKVRCSDKLDVLSRLDLSALAPQIAHLDLSRNAILDVGSGYFLNFTNLKKLDLSNNKIEVLEDHAFDGLSNLDVLKLSSNNLTRISKEILLNFIHLKKLDIGNNSLDCDCAQSWLFEWVQNFSGKLISKCASPVQARGLPFLQWYNRSISMCGSHILSLDILKIQPQQDQVVFEGDRLRLQCQASLVGLDSPSISWFWGKQDPAVAFSDVHLDSVNVSDNGTLVSALVIDELSTNHSGQWNCLLVSGQTNHSRTVSVIVISEKTAYCPQTVTRNNKGVYVWPQTVVGFGAELPCEATDFDNFQQYHAYHSCDSEGKWHSLNTSLCPYASKTTQLLQDFLKMNLSEDHGPAIVESAQQLLNLSCGTPLLSDKMDAIFLSTAISNYLRFLAKYKEVGPLLIDMVSCITQMPRSLLRAAQLEDKASSKLVKAVETVTQYSSPLQSQRATLAVEKFHVSPESFLGLTCVWYSIPDESGSIAPASARSSQISHCSEGNYTAAFMLDRAKASVQIPPTLFSQLERQGQSVQGSLPLLISMYENSHLFPQVNYNESSDRWDVVSSVIGAKLVGLDVGNLVEPLYIVVRAPSVREAGAWARPVWWDEDMNAGAGGWSKQGCTLSHLMHGKVVFFCDRFGYFGLLQEMPYEFEHRLPRSILQLAHPAVYIGSLILILSLIIAIVTYVVAGPHIQMPKRTKHALINTWIAIALLSFMFSIGVHQTDDVDLCQSVGMILHYLTLCALLWMAVTVSNMRSSVSKKHPLEMGSEDDLPSSSAPPPKPLLGLYLVGWGIGLMVVGVSGAVNLKQYLYLVRDEYCFLVPNSALGAVLVPCAAVVVYLLVCVLLVRCDLSQRQADTNAQLSDGTQGTENVDLDLLDCAVPAVGRAGVGGYSVASTVSSEVEDAEHSPATQLRAALIVLLLFALLWAAGALATARQLHSLLPQAELVFSVVYAVTALLLAAFVLFFHCFARSDVRPCWMVRCRGRNVSDARASAPTAAAAAAGDKQLAEVTTDKISNADRSVISQANGGNGAIGRGPVSNHLSSTNSVNSSKSRNQRAAVELNKSSTPTPKQAPASPQGQDANKDSNLHLMPVYRSYPNVVDAEMFYNPRQSDMARKFFRKQKRQAMCSGQGPDFRRRGDGQGNLSDAESTLRDSLKGSGSKVSNTNIHVEQRLSDTSPGPGHAHSFNILTSEANNASVNAGANNQERWVIGADSPPPVNNDGTVRSTASVDGNMTPGKMFDRGSRRRRSRGVRDVSGSHDKPHEKYQGFTRNGTMSSVSSSIRSRDVEMEGDFMRVSVLEEAPTSVALQKTPIYPWDNGSVVSGASFSLDRVSEAENDVCSMSRSSRRSSRSAASRKRYRRPEPSSLRSHPTSLASSIVSLQNKDTHIGSYPALSEASSTNGAEDSSALSKKETCV